MKKYFNLLLAITILSISAFTSCTNDIPDQDESAIGKASRVKTLTFSDGSWEESFSFNYREDGKISSVTKSEGNSSVDYVFDWSVSGKLTMTNSGKTKVYDVNSDGYITKDAEDWGYNTYEYNEDRILVKVTEYWDGGSEVKFEVTAKNANVLKHDYVKSGKNNEKIFDLATGVNLCKIQQTNPVDSNWKTQAGLYGKASNLYVLTQTYGVVGATKSSVKLGYKFDESRRPSSITRAGSGWSETTSYTYED